MKTIKEILENVSVNKIKLKANDGIGKRSDFFYVNNSLLKRLTSLKTSSRTLIFDIYIYHDEISHKLSNKNDINNWFKLNHINIKI